MKNINKLENQKGITVINLVLSIVIIITLGVVGFLAYQYVTLSEQNQIAELDESNNVTNLNNLNSNSTNSSTAVELDVSDELVKELNKKVNFQSYILDELTSSGEVNFIDEENENYVKNDTILRIGFSEVDTDEFVPITTDNNTGVIPYKLKETILDDSIKNIFNSKIEYINKDFIPTNSSEFNGYENYDLIIRYNEFDNEYNFTQTMGGGGLTPFIEQVVDKAYKVDENTIKLEMKTAFIDIGGFGEGGKATYKIYKEYDDGKYKELLGEEFTINFSDSNEKDSWQSYIRELDLNTAVYTFKLDDATNEYYLAEYKFK